MIFLNSGKYWGPQWGLGNLDLHTKTGNTGWKSQMVHAIRLVASPQEKSEKAPSPIFPEGRGGLYIGNVWEASENMRFDLRRWSPPPPPTLFSSLVDLEILVAVLSSTTISTRGVCVKRKHP